MSQPVQPFEQLFGVEIEMTGISSEVVVKTLNDFFQSKSFYDKYPKDSMGRYWHVKHDITIKPVMPKKASVSKYAFELVTPKLKGEADLETFLKIVNLIEGLGAKVNPSCGIHVHVDAGNHTLESLKSLIKTFYTHQNILYTALNVYPERLKYCRMLKKNLLHEIDSLKPTTLENLIKISDHTSRFDTNPKYRGLNITNIGKLEFRNTVEFRLLNSTFNINDIKAYIKFCLFLSAQAINRPFTEFSDSNEILNMKIAQKPSIAREYMEQFLRVFKIAYRGVTGKVIYSKYRYTKTQATLWLRSLGLDNVSITVLTKNLKDKTSNLTISRQDNSPTF